MNKKKFAEAVSMVDDKYYEEAANYQRKKKAPVWLKWGALAACLCLIFVGVFDYVSKVPNSSATQYGVIAEVVEVLENGKYEVKITGEDENFSLGDIVIINYDFTVGGAEQSLLKTGDSIAITYSTFEKTDTVYEITPGQIEIVE